ncbi:PilW family protein, partial [Methylicorpusculum sp.]
MSINFPAPSAKIQTPDRLSMSDPRASNRQRTFSRPKQSGMTLVEIMISLLIGAILLGGVLQIFLSTKQTYRMQEGLSRLQENARFAMEFLTNDIRMAGYFGCLSQVTSITNTLNNPTSYLINFAIPIQGSEWLTASSTWSPTVDTSIISPLPGSDVITIRSASPQGVTVTSHPAGNNDQGSGSADLKLSSNLDPGIQNCDILVVSDCMRIAIFQVTNFNSANNNNTVHNVGGACTNPGNATKALGKNFENGEVYRAQNISYYVRQNSAFVTGALNPPPPSLYRVMNSAAAEELVEGIEQ